MLLGLLLSLGRGETLHEGGLLGGHGSENLGFLLVNDRGCPPLLFESGILDVLDLVDQGAELLVGDFRSPGVFVDPSWRVGGEAHVVGGSVLLMSLLQEAKGE